MLKTGIYRRDQLNLRALRTFFGRRRFIAVTLYPEVASEGTDDSAALLEQILRRFPGAAGTYKRTQRRRFGAFDEMVVELIEERLPGDRSLVVHDLAVSDGSTAVDLFERLSAIDAIQLRFFASDLSPDVVAVARRGASLAAVLDPATNQPLQVIWPPFVFNVEKRESALLYPINRALLVILLRTRVRRLLERYSAADPAIRTRHIRLLAPVALDTLESDPRFDFERHDILQPLAGRFGLIRAMNILNRSYFEDDQLRVAIGHVARALTTGGLFATGSNQDAGSAVDGAVYERTKSGFRRLRSSGNGSPVDDLVLETEAPDDESADVIE